MKKKIKKNEDLIFLKKKIEKRRTIFFLN